MAPARPGTKRARDLDGGSGGALARAAARQRRLGHGEPSPTPTSPTSPRSSARRSASAASSWTFASDGFVLDDGTAHAPVVLRGEAADWIPLIEPGDAINVIGRVERLDDGALGVVVTDPAAIVLGSDPAAIGVAGLRTGELPPASNEPSGASGGLRSAAFGDDLGSLPGAGAGLASLLGISLASVAVTLLRRRQARRLLSARVAARVAAIAGAETRRGRRGARRTARRRGPSPDRRGLSVA